MKISIVIPVYNCEDYIEKMIESILNQNYKNYELIIVNDGSTDTTKEKIQKYKQANIKIINQKNGGVSSARNKALSFATGELICFFDADDYIDQGCFEEIIKYFEKNPNIEFLCFGYFSQTDPLNFDIINYKEKFYKSKKEIKEDLVKLYDRALLYNCSNKVYLRKIIEKNKLKFPNFNFGEDLAFNRLYLDSINNMYNSSKCFYHYIRERNESLTKKYDKDIFKIRKREFYEFNEYFEKWGLNKDEYYEFSCRRYVERIIACIEIIHSSGLKFKKKYLFVKNVITDKLTKETLKFAKPESKRIKIILIPIKLQSVLITYIMGKMIHIFRMYNPGLFNKMKNKSRFSNFFKY